MATSNSAKLQEHNFSLRSKRQLRKLRENNDYVYTGDSINPDASLGLFTIRRLQIDDIICTYEGIRITEEEAQQREDNGKSTSHMFSIGDGIVVDGFGYRFGAVMANHHCRPNAALDVIRLDSPEHAPVGILRALQEIPQGAEVVTACNYPDATEAWERCSCSAGIHCSGWIGKKA